MIKGRVSVVVPSRNEKYLQRTIDSLLTNARGDLEIYAVLDGGPWPDPPLKDDPRVIVIRNTESIGMRPSTNAVAQIASGEYFCKIDAHCIVEPGWDENLKAHCEDNWIVIPARHSIDDTDWTVKPKDWTYTILTYPYNTSQYGSGLHAVTFPHDMNKQINRERNVEIDDLLSFQGSFWFMKTAYFHWLQPLTVEGFGTFYGEAVQMALLCWQANGRVKILRSSWYAHWHKSRTAGRGFFLSLKDKRRSEAFGADFFVNNRWPRAERTFESVIEQFWPMLSRMQDPKYIWPEDWRDFEKHRRAFENRPPEAIPLHT